MIEFEKAFEITQNQAFIPKTESVSFRDCRGSVLAENVYSDISMPPFDKSAMDGYACRYEDLQNELEVLEVIAAGAAPQYKIGKNQCSKIMTGGMVPEGADTVIIVEDIMRTGENRIRFAQAKTGRNICYTGEDVKKGDLVLAEGEILTSRHIAVLASAGKTEVKVYQKPKVGVIVTGDELKEPHEELGSADIRNSNAYALISQLEEMHIQAKYYGIVGDDLAETQAKFKKAADENDILISSGAVSVGDFDFVPQVLKEYGFEIHFHGMNVKPGKRTIFGTKAQNKAVFGLPGNPVSTFAQFLFLVKPFILKSMGTKPVLRFLQFPLEKDFERKRGDKTEFIPVKLTTDSKVAVREYHGSAHFHALVESNGFLMLPAGVTEIKTGEPGKVFLF